MITRRDRPQRCAVKPGTMKVPGAPMPAAPAAAARTALSADQVRQYREQGVVLLDRVVPPEHLALLRDECAVAMRTCDAAMDAAGKTVDGINHKGSRYFIG